VNDAPCSPGSHPHSDRPNWRPADNPDDYLRNCKEGLEKYSQRRMAKLLGISRMQAWRWELMAQIPEDLFNLLMEKSKRKPSTKSLAAVGEHLRNQLNGGGHMVKHDDETCPNCGYVLRRRHHMSDETIKIVNEWLAANREAAP
jgi:hypothetical protein